MKAVAISRATLAAAVMMCIVALPAEGQGLLRRAQQAVTRTVEDAVGVTTGTESETPAASASDNIPSGSAAGSSHPAILTLDAAVLDRFALALTSEIETRDEWVTFEQNFVNCQGTMYTNQAMLDELMRISDQMSSEMERATTTDDIIRVSEQHQQRMDALVEKHCGLSQTDFAARQSNINEDVMQAALTAGAFTDGQYAMLKERIVPFCMAGGSKDSVAGPEGDDFYVYTAVEVAALAPRCAVLMPQVEQTI